MHTRDRILGFGTSGVLVLIGAVCGVAFSGTLGQILLFVFISLGLTLAVALVFYEVGLSEDRERAMTRPRDPPSRPTHPSARWPRGRLPRSDGHRRRL
jgi:hypothetical protein